MYLAFVLEVMKKPKLLNEISRKSYKGKKLEFTYKGKAIDTESARFDIIEPKELKLLEVLPAWIKITQL